MSADIIRLSPRAPQPRVDLRIISPANLSAIKPDDKIVPLDWLDSVAIALLCADAGFPAAVISRIRDRRQLLKAVALGPALCIPKMWRGHRSRIVATERLYGSRLLTERGALTPELDALLTVVERARAEFLSIELCEVTPAEIVWMPILRAALLARRTLPRTEVVVIADDREAVGGAWAKCAGTVRT